MQTPTARRVRPVLAFAALLALGLAHAAREDRPDRFRQLREELPTPGTTRTASGAPGHAYWQQQVDYDIDVVLDEDERRITGAETITYHNNSPDPLSYLWVALDPNLHAPTSHAQVTALAPDLESLSLEQLQDLVERPLFDGTCHVLAVRGADGRPLAHTVNDTMMRVDLPTALQPGSSTRLAIDWTYRINDAKQVPGRSGYEAFDDGNCIFEIAQWFPRLCAYTDYTGWQNKQFLGRGEFTLEFGDYRVRISVPADHVVASTGVLQNPGEVLEPVWRERLTAARDVERALFVVTPEEAAANQQGRSAERKTWEFWAENVRDFAWASSRKFIWDAVLHPVEGGQPVWAMSYYPLEGEPLWSRYSTHAVQHTLDVYSRHTFPYPYPVAISVNGPVGGMEYPMICFNGPRPEPDGTYSERTKYGLIGVVIHEVGHNWFPMIVNSDERQWTWMDEGLNTFVQFLAEQEWEHRYPSRRGEARNITGYMSSASKVPIMTNSESLLQFGNNAYAKPATALNVLRETVMGRELFDFAFREYANRWRFKRPEPADLFRTLEDASAVDLDWFFRGWFFTTNACDLALAGVTRYRLDSLDPEERAARARERRAAEPESVTDARNADVPRRSDRFPELLDFYNEFDPLEVTPEERAAYAKRLEGLDDEQRALLASRLNAYVLEVVDEGGLPMPLVFELTYSDGNREELRVPAQVWRSNDRTVRKLVLSEKELVRVVLDPYLETADVDLTDNTWPTPLTERVLRAEPRPTRGGGGNPMRAARERERVAGEDGSEQDAPPAAAPGAGAGARGSDAGDGR